MVLTKDQEKELLADGSADISPISLKKIISIPSQLKTGRTGAKRRKTSKRAEEEDFEFSESSSEGGEGIESDPDYSPSDERPERTRRRVPVKRVSPLAS